MKSFKHIFLLSFVVLMTASVTRVAAKDPVPKNDIGITTDNFELSNVGLVVEVNYCDVPVMEYFISPGGKPLFFGVSKTESFNEFGMLPIAVSIEAGRSNINPDVALNYHTPFVSKKWVWFYSHHYSS